MVTHDYDCERADTQSLFFALLTDTVARQTSANGSVILTTEMAERAIAQVPAKAGALTFRKP